LVSTIVVDVFAFEAGTVALDRCANSCHVRDMTITRLDHISVVVDDLAPVKSSPLALLHDGLHTSAAL
jgi:hypothetical protein